MDSSVAAEGDRKRHAVPQPWPSRPAGSSPWSPSPTPCPTRPGLLGRPCAPAYRSGWPAMLMGCVLAGVITAPSAPCPSPSRHPTATSWRSSPCRWRRSPGRWPGYVRPGRPGRDLPACAGPGDARHGLVLGGLGLARAGRLVRFVPFPVIAGFLGASGWFLVVGGVGVAAGRLTGSPARPGAGAAAAGARRRRAAARRRPQGAGPSACPADPWLLLHHAVAIWLGTDLGGAGRGRLAAAGAGTARGIPYPGSGDAGPGRLVGDRPPLPDLPLLILVATSAC